MPTRPWRIHWKSYETVTGPALSGAATSTGPASRMKVIMPTRIRRFNDISYADDWTINLL
jgi:hypothetical protein